MLQAGNNTLFKVIPHSISYGCIKGTSPLIFCIGQYRHTWNLICCYILNHNKSLLKYSLHGMQTVETAMCTFHAEISCKDLENHLSRSLR